MVHGAGGGHLAELRLPCPHYGCLRKSVLLLFLFFFLIFSRIALLPWPCKHVPAAPRAVMLLSADYYLLPTVQVLVDHTEHVLVHTLAVENKMCYTTWSNHE